MVSPTPLRPKLKPSNGAPSHLAKVEADLFARIVRSYGLHDEVSRQILEEGLTSLQRAREARETIDREGVSFRDRWGQIKANPVCAIERDARAAALSAFRQLNLEMLRPKSKEIDWGVT
jgi:phage terminase small subunit